MVYLFKVKLSHRKRIWRTIAIKGNQTLNDLHEAIFYSFDRVEDHLYSFYMTNGDKKRDRFKNSPEYTHPLAIEDGSDKSVGNAAKTKIGDLKLAKKDKFEYLFDFGDEWLHEVVLEKIEETKSKIKYPATIKTNGESPEQYPDYDEED